jgi:secondary thiamine-phosphate synthase enzyme
VLEKMGRALKKTVQELCYLAYNGPTLRGTRSEALSKIRSLGGSNALLVTGSRYEESLRHPGGGEEMTSFTLKTTARCEMVDITDRLAALVTESGIRDGVCRVFVPHTTAGITINENADPDVPRDILAALDRIVPHADRYRHAEGNAAAHIKASLFGASQTAFIENGRLLLGRWQSFFFCEFDGPRTREVLIRLTAG